MNRWDKTRTIIDHIWKEAIESESKDPRLYTYARIRTVLYSEEEMNEAIEYIDKLKEEENE